MYHTRLIWYNSIVSYWYHYCIGYTSRGWSTSEVQLDQYEKELRNLREGIYTHNNNNNNNNNNNTIQLCALTISGNYFQGIKFSPKLNIC